MSHMIERVHLTVAEVTHPLAPAERVGDLKAAIRDAVRSGGDFVEVTLATGQRVSIFTTISSNICITVDTVDMDAGIVNGESTTDYSEAPVGMCDVSTSFDII